MVEVMVPAPARPGDRVAILSPSFAAPGFAPAVHEQAMRRFRDVTGLEPVEYPTTREVGASPEDRARDINAAFADPGISAICSSIGGDDQVTVIPHLDVDVIRAHPKRFLGYSDNTNLHAFLWNLGIGSFYGGATQVHLGPGPGVESAHAQTLRAALLGIGSLELTEPGESEDHGIDWLDQRALTQTGERHPTGPWQWHGPRWRVEGPTWGGCIEVLRQILIAGRFPADPTVLDGHILLLETSEMLIEPGRFRDDVRAMGERGMLSGLVGALVARPPAVNLHMGEDCPDLAARDAYREQIREVAVSTVARYNPEAVVVTGIPFGHTVPQVIVPHGGTMMLDAVKRTVRASYL